MAGGSLILLVDPAAGGFIVLLAAVAVEVAAFAVSQAVALRQVVPDG